MGPNLNKIRAFALDIDGVMTDGGVLAMPDGDILRVFNAKDSFALRMASLNGYGLAVITGGRSQSIFKRALMCGVPEGDVYLWSRNKERDLRKFCQAHGYSLDEVVYFGDDIPDVDAIKAAGMGVAPADACQECLDAADFVSDYPGGHGCVRQTVEMVLKAQGRWKFDTDSYEKRF